MASAPDPFEAYKKNADSKVGEKKVYLQKLKDSRDEAFIKARRDIDYEIDGNRKKFAKDIANKLEDEIKSIYHMEDDVDTDSSEFKALMTKHHGLTRKQIKRIVDGTPNADDIYNTLDREITQADSNLRQEHFYQMSQDLVDTDDPDTFEHAIKYMGLDKYSTFDSAAAKRQPEQLRRLFIRHGIEGRVNETHLPAELKKQIKEKEKNAA